MCKVSKVVNKSPFLAAPADRHSALGPNQIIGLRKRGAFNDDCGRLRCGCLRFGWRRCESTSSTTTSPGTTTKTIISYRRIFAGFSSTPDARRPTAASLAGPKCKQTERPTGSRRPRAKRFHFCCVNLIAWSGRAVCFKIGRLFSTRLRLIHFVNGTRRAARIMRLVGGRRRLPVVVGGRRWSSGAVEGRRGGCRSRQVGPTRPPTSPN